MASDKRRKLTNEDIEFIVQTWGQAFTGILLCIAKVADKREPGFLEEVHDEIAAFIEASRTAGAPPSGLDAMERVRQVLHRDLTRPPRQ